MLPVPPAIFRAEYARIHTFGDSMAWFVKSNGKEKTRVGAYLKQFHFYNLDDHTWVGAKVAEIIDQIRKFFRDWSTVSITKTVLPAGTFVHYTNVVPPTVKRDGKGEDEYFSPKCSMIEGPGRPRPVFLDSDIALIFVTHNDVCKDDNGRKEMSDWTHELTTKWAEVIDLALCFPRAAIICGGPASTMGWSDHRYAAYTSACIGQCHEAGVFAFDGKEYFQRMEMGADEWHWASTDANREIFAEMYRDLTYALSLMVLPQTWKEDQVRQGFHFLGADPNTYDPVSDDPVTVDRQGDVTMGEPEPAEETEADRLLAEEVAGDMESETDSAGLALTGVPITGVDSSAPSTSRAPESGGPCPPRRGS
jgi:hypothetical protein